MDNLSRVAAIEVHGAAQLCEQLQAAGIHGLGYGGWWFRSPRRCGLCVGDERTIRRRFGEHRQAGADHVCVQAISSSGPLPDERLLEFLAPKF
jgi:hypothetical protein